MNTLHEYDCRLRELDPDVLVDVLKISSDEIVDRFDDKVIEMWQSEENPSEEIDD